MSRIPTTKLVYQGRVFRIEFYVSMLGICPAEEWLERQTESEKTKYSALFAILADVGRIWNERKFKHLTGTSQLFEFKVNAGRVLCFFVMGKRVVLTHGFSKRANKTPPQEIARAEMIRFDFMRREAK